MKSWARDIENEGYERGVKQGLEQGVILGIDLSLVWFTVQTQENRSDYQRTKGKNTGNLPSMDLWLQEDCSRTWTYKRPSSAGSRYNS